MYQKFVGYDIDPKEHISIEKVENKTRIKNLYMGYYPASHYYTCKLFDLFENIICDISDYDVDNNVVIDKKEITPIFCIKTNKELFVFAFDEKNNDMIVYCCFNYLYHVEWFFDDENHCFVVSDYEKYNFMELM